MSGKPAINTTERLFFIEGYDVGSGCILFALYPHLYLGNYHYHVIVLYLFAYVSLRIYVLRNNE